MTKTSGEVEMKRTKKIFGILLVIVFIGIAIIPIVTIQAKKHTNK